ncbi:hypothetical protein KXV85_003865, partial [Aspergillus fumigatus]
MPMASPRLSGCAIVLRAVANVNPVVRAIDESPVAGSLRSMHWRRTTDFCPDASVPRASTRNT